MSRARWKDMKIIIMGSEIKKRDIEQEFLAKLDSGSLFVLNRRNYCFKILMIQKFSDFFKSIYFLIVGIDSNVVI